MLASAIAPDVESVKTHLKHIWMVGDYDRFSRYMEHSAREFYVRLLVVPGYRLLDVGCGSGQLALMAAKDGLAVTGVDIASNWVERARARAQARVCTRVLRRPMPRRCPLRMQASTWWRA
jgi:2-polyprenyl-3-methyl-5-hydroxy-6-metoxy-1,4-benzoquinol methylase